MKKILTEISMTAVYAQFVVTIFKIYTGFLSCFSAVEICVVHYAFQKLLLTLKRTSLNKKLNVWVVMLKLKLRSTAVTFILIDLSWSLRRQTAILDLNYIQINHLNLKIFNARSKVKFRRRVQFIILINYRRLKQRQRDFKVLGYRRCWTFCKNSPPRAKLKMIKTRRNSISLPTLH